MLCAILGHLLVYLFTKPEAKTVKTAYESSGYAYSSLLRHGYLVKLGHGYAVSSCWIWHIKVKPVGSSSLTKVLYTSYH
nr:hypothetical protein [Tanacetum cinerariifolium]GEW50065.1 hypothetical protein [Tanacetum cinerariifolium]